MTDDYPESVVDVLREFGQRRGVESAVQLAAAFDANGLNQQISAGEKRRLLHYLNTRVSEPETADKN